MNETTPMEVAGIYYISKITGDNRHTADLAEGYIVQYDFNRRFGWMRCASFSTIEDAKEFAANLKNQQN